MNLYKVYNGVTGIIDISCLVTSKTSERSIELAREVFIKAFKIPEYYENLIAIKVFEDCTTEQVSDIES